MKTNYISLFFVLASFLFLGACKKDKTKKAGNPVLEPVTQFSEAHFGDSLDFTIKVSDGQVPLSTLKAQLFFGEEMVSDVVIRTKTDGEYSGKLFVPFLPNVPDGNAQLKFILQNIHLTLTEQVIDLPVSRPDFPYLTLVTETQEYKMEKTAKNQYAVRANLPSKVKGYLKSPKVGAQGNELTFGWEDNAIAVGSTEGIPFSNFSSGEYAIEFNTLDFEGSPFIIAYAINGQVMSRLDEDHFHLVSSFTKGEPLVIDGIDNLADWWLDPDFITDNGGGSFAFAPESGQYRITADFKLQYFRFELMDGGSPATLHPDGSGGVWIIGDGIGKPSVATNQVGWNPEKALLMAPIGNKHYQVTVVAGTSVNSDDINFKFFHQRDWGGEFGSTTLSSTSEYIFVGDGENGRDSGNLGLNPGIILTPGLTYVLTLDLSAGSEQGVLHVTTK